MVRKKSNGEGSITTIIKNGKTYYRGSITLGWSAEGKQIRKTFGSYKRYDIVDKINTAKYEAKHNLLTGGDMPFGDAFKSWIDNHKKIEVLTHTYLKYETALRLRILPYSISRKKLNQITLADLQFYFNEMKHKYTNATIKETYGLINAFFKFSVLQGLVIKNYCPGVTLAKIKKDNKTVKVFSLEEQDMIIKTLDLRDIVDCVIYFTFYTGLRLGEVLGTKWSDINGNIITISRQWARRTDVDTQGKKKLSYEFRDLKTENGARTIPLIDKVISMLNNIPKTGELIFNDRGKGLDHKRPQRKIKKLCEELNIPHRSFHSIRHSYATRLFELDIPVKTTQSLMGHADITTTLNTYTHVMQDKKMEIVDKLNNLLN